MGKQIIPENVIRANLQKFGFCKRNLEVLARKMKTYNGKAVQYDAKKDQLFI